MARNSFWQLGSFGQKGRQSQTQNHSTRAKRKRARGTKLRMWELGLERLEERVVLSADPVLSVVADQFVDESTPLVISDLGTFTDVVEGTVGGGDAIGLDPLDYESLALANGAFDPLISVTIDTDMLTISGGFSGTGTTVMADTGFGPYQIAVFAFTDFELDAGVTINTVGTRPLALLSLADMGIAGTINVSARTNFLIDDSAVNLERIAGPGGGNGGLGNFTGTASMGFAAAGAPISSVGSPTVFGSNAGGGTGGGMGGNGGRADTAGSGGGLIGPEGLAFASVATLSLGVQGGSGGGTSNSGPFGIRVSGGGGGGGIELGAVGTVTIASTGQVLANGGDAFSPGVGSVTQMGGGGGGAGGGIVIHANSVNQFGLLSANGGDGGFAPRDGGGGGGGAILIAYSDTGTFDNSGGVQSVVGGVNSPATGGEDGQPGFVEIVEEAPSATPIIEAFDYVIDWGDLSTPDVGSATIDVPGVSIGDIVSGSFDGSHTYTDNGVYVVTVTINDDNGGTHQQAFLVTVANVAPTATLTNDGPVNEGSTATVSFSGQTDPSPDDTTAGFRYAYDFDNDGIWDVGDGSYAGSVGSDSQVVPASYLADGPAGVTVKARVLDDDDGYTDYFTVIDVDNVAPSLAADIAAVTVNEGDTATNSGTYADPGDDTISLTASVGIIVDNGDGTWSWSYGTADGPDDSVLVTITATDSDGDSSDTSFQLNVDNVAPSVAADNAVVTVNEGDTATNSGTYGDPGADTVSLVASVGILVDNGDGTWSWSLGTADGPDDSVLVTITATDSDGEVSDTSFQVNVDNVAPTADAGGPYTTFIDTPITLNGSGSDVPGDLLSYEWFLGAVEDGILISTDASATFDPEALGILVTSTVTVTLRVTDDDGASTLATAQVNVLGPGTWLVDGTLYVIGTNEHDVVAITKQSSNLKVVATFQNNNPQLYSLASVNAIDVRVRGGNDVVVLTNNVVLPTTIDGGSGNDVLTAGGGNTVIYGGTGNDVLIGGQGNNVLIGGDGQDVITGGNGRDLIIGGLSSDVLSGGSGEDILIGGWTIYDSNTTANRSAIDAIMDVWTSGASFNARVATLTGSGGLLQATGADQAVFDDDACDLLVGGGGRDLLFADTNLWDGAIDLVAYNFLQDALVAVN